MTDVVTRAPTAGATRPVADAVHRAGRALRRGWLLLAVGVLAGLGGGLVALQAVTPLHRTTTVLLVRPEAATTPAAQLAARAAATTRAVGLAQIGGTLPAERRAGALAGLPGDPPDLGLQVFSSATGADPFVTVTVLGPDAARVEALARAYVTALPEAAEQLSIFPDREVDLMVLREPPPPERVYPPTVRMLLAGAGGGLALGLGLLVTPALLTHRLRSWEEVEAHTGWPVLARVPRTPTTTGGPGEAHRALALELAAADPPPGRVEVVDGDRRGRDDVEGLAAGLTAALAERHLDLPVTVAGVTDGRSPWTAAPGGRPPQVLLAVSDRRPATPRDLRRWARAFDAHPRVGVVVVDADADGDASRTRKRLP